MVIRIILPNSAHLFISAKKFTPGGAKNRLNRSPGEHKTLIFVSVKSLKPLGSRLFPLYHGYYLHVPFDRKVIQIRVIGDSRKGYPLREKGGSNYAPS